MVGEDEENTMAELEEDDVGRQSTLAAGDYEAKFFCYFLDDVEMVAAVLFVGSDYRICRSSKGCQTVVMPAAICVDDGALNWCSGGTQKFGYTNPNHQEKNQISAEDSVKQKSSMF
ncbi:hypothetical protein ACLOJK_004616 [Asimina triloba]